MAEIQVTQIDEKPYKTDQNMVDNISLQKTTPKDKILDKFYDEIGYSRFHLIQISLIYILNVSIGSETIFLNVIQLQIINEWSLEIHQMAMLASFFSFGIALGTHKHLRFFFFKKKNIGYILFNLPFFSIIL